MWRTTALCFLCLRFGKAAPVVDDITVEWSGGKTTIASINSLQEVIPDGKNFIRVKGVVAVIHQGEVSDLNLTNLVLSDVQLTKIEDNGFKNLQLNHLSLSSNQLEELGYIFDNVALTSLELYDNKITKIIPRAIAKVKGLLNLGLSKNLVENLTGLASPTLQHLDLQFNSISTLKPGDLLDLPQLQTLELVGNKLEEIPEGVFNNTKITHLKLNYNQISKIASKAFDNMAELSVLHLDHNKLAQWDNQWLQNTPKIAYVIAGFNQIETIPAEAFKNFPKIYSLDLQENRIKSIAPGAFDKTESIVNLNLRGNQIGSWSGDVLGNVSVSTLFLDDNQLKCIGGDLGEVFQTVYFGVSLSGNFWDEDCENKIDYYHPSSI